MSSVITLEVELLNNSARAINAVEYPKGHEKVLLLDKRHSFKILGIDKVAMNPMSAIAP